MTEENKKRINKLMIPFTRRTVSVLTAATILATSVVGCKEKEKNNKDTSSIISSVSDEEITSSDNKFTSADNSSIINNESSENEQSSKNEVSNNVTSNNKNNSTNTTSSNKNQNNTSSINIPSVSTPSQTPTTQTMPTKLTAENINDVEVFKHFAGDIAIETRGNMGGSWIYYYNDKTYMSIGIPEPEFYYFLAAININSMNNGTLNELLGAYSDDDLNRFNTIIDAIASAVDKSNKVNDWSNLIINKKDLAAIENIEKSFLEYKKGINKDNLKKILDNGIGTDSPIIKRYCGYLSMRVFTYDNYEDPSYNSVATELYVQGKTEATKFAESLYNRINKKSLILK